MPDIENGWNEYQKLVISQLNDCRSRLSTIERRLTRMEVDVGMLRVKATAWGAVAGTIPATLMWLMVSYG
jgi:hypothetical protein